MKRDGKEQKNLQYAIENRNKNHSQLFQTENVIFKYISQLYLYTGFPQVLEILESV